MKKLVILVSALALTFTLGCGSMYINSQPVKAYSGADKSDAEIALIAGQGYMESVGNWIQVYFEEVDGKSIATARNSYLVKLEPGVHQIKIKAALGNGASSLQASGIYKMTVEAGKAYQITYEQSGYNIAYFLCETGNVESYFEYFKRNKEISEGSPVPCGESSNFMPLELVAEN